jgi:hypothetical protein
MPRTYYTLAVNINNWACYIKYLQPSKNIGFDPWGGWVGTAMYRDEKRINPWAGLGTAGILELPTVPPFNSRSYCTFRHDMDKVWIK